MDRGMPRREVTSESKEKKNFFILNPFRGGGKTSVEET